MTQGVICVSIILEGMELVDFYRDCFVLMDAWNKMKNVTKANICALCVPFRDKYKLTDLQTLMIARGEMKASEILKIGEKIKE